GAGNLFCLHVFQNRNVRQAVQTLLQHSVRLQLRHEFKHRHMLDDPGQINGRLDAGIAASDDGDVFACEQWTIAMRTVSYTFIFEFRLTRYVAIAPTGTCREYDGFALEYSAAFQFTF